MTKQSIQLFFRGSLEGARRGEEASAETEALQEIGNEGRHSIPAGQGGRHPNRFVPRHDLSIFGARLPTETFGRSIFSR